MYSRTEFSYFGVQEYTTQQRDQIFELFYKNQRFVKIIFKQIHDFLVNVIIHLIVLLVG